MLEGGEQGIKEQVQTQAMKEQQRELKMSAVTVLSILLMLLPCQLEAKALMEILKVGDKSPVSVDSTKANQFLSGSRVRRSIDPPWYRQSPDFQSYYKYYTSIGHTEGLYEVDKIRIQYQQMRLLEQLYGTSAVHYQSKLGLPQAPPPSQVPPPMPVSAPVAPPLSQTPPLSQADVFYLCNSQDPQCLPHIVFLPRGARPALCDPRLHANCATLGPALKQTPPPKLPPPPPMKKPEPAPLPVIKKYEPAPPPALYKAMEYDCDPYWDPDCLIDHPPRPLGVKGQMRTEPDHPPEVIIKKHLSHVFLPHHDPREELYDPQRHSYPSAEK
ncbi:hypothetical protein DNTS_010120 [Danionella cerebrum]|uniref:Actinodin3 n=1 Tax=Danionella cerebrum TaxID=2873325 RepID=A0A553MM82_9TELE|nr:hypothetical protein DNTS_010120 [Danionella translucida]